MINHLVEAASRWVKSYRTRIVPDDAIILVYWSNSAETLRLIVCFNDKYSTVRAAVGMPLYDPTRLDKYHVLYLVCTYFIYNTSKYKNTADRIRVQYILVLVYV